MAKEKEVCPLLEAKGWEAECEKINEFYCPLSWQVFED